ncbi:MAG: pyruvate dehydrogenase (acetyl-transferring) E1 component subunit alpha [Planctomycetota bacterium]
MTDASNDKTLGRGQVPGSSAQLLSIIDGRSGRAKGPCLTEDELLELYRCMLLTRIMEERALNLQRQGRIGFYVPCMGQEASHIGTAYALEPSDWIFPAYRQPGIMMLRGAPLQQIIDEWYGNDGDVSKGRQMPVHHSFRSIHFVSISSPIGTQLTQATGAAMAARYRKEDTVVMTYCGDGGTSENDFHSALNFAGVYDAPVVFVCENNHWAISVPLEGQTASETIAIKAEAYGIPGVRVDGNDVLAVYQVAREATERARKGKGPTLIETVTYRMGPHSSSDDPTRYRESGEVEAWLKKDPLERFKSYLKSQRIWSQELEDRMRDELKTTVNEAVKKAEAKPMPTPASMFEDVYRDMTAQLEEQQGGLLDSSESDSQEEGQFPL